MSKWLQEIVDFFNGSKLIIYLKERFNAGLVNALFVIFGIVGSLVVVYNFLAKDFVSLLPFAIGAGLVFFWTGILKGINTPK